MYNMYPAPRVYTVSEESSDPHPCLENGTTSKNCLVIQISDVTSTSDIMFSYQLFQTCLIWTGLGAGLLSMCHMIYCVSRWCRNLPLVFLTVFVGFLHLSYCVYLLSVSEASAAIHLTRGGTLNCIDYFPSATLANSAILVAITICMLRHSVSSSAQRYSAGGYLLISSFCAVILLYRLQHEIPAEMKQETFASFGDVTSFRLDVNWAVCLKYVNQESFRLVYEYLLIYGPVLVITLWVCIQRRRKSSGCFVLRINIISTRCHKYECSGIKCVCSKLNNAFIAILYYSFAILCIGRPAQILYGYVTSGMFRDVLPSLLHTVMYCFLCSEYIIWLFRGQQGKMKSTGSQVEMV